jgi:hypothetical protein
MASLANLLVNGVFMELGSGVEARMNKIAGLFARFTGHVGDSAAARAEIARPASKTDGTR